MSKKGETQPPLERARRSLSRARTEYRRACVKHQEELKQRTARIDELQQIVKDLEQ